MSGRDRQIRDDPPLDREDVREGAKAAIREFLDEQFAKFGRWSFYGLASIVLCALVYWAASMHGWHK